MSVALALCYFSFRFFNFFILSKLIFIVIHFSIKILIFNHRPNIVRTTCKLYVLLVSGSCVLVIPNWIGQRLCIERRRRCRSFFKWDLDYSGLRYILMTGFIYGFLTGIVNDGLCEAIPQVNLPSIIIITLLAVELI